MLKPGLTYTVLHLIKLNDWWFILVTKSVLCINWVPKCGDWRNKSMRSQATFANCAHFTAFQHASVSRLALTGCWVL